MSTDTAIAEGSTAICLTCQHPIMWCTRTEPGYLPRTGWRDALPSPLHCGASRNFDHQPNGDGIFPP